MSLDTTRAAFETWHRKQCPGVPLTRNEPDSLFGDTYVAPLVEGAWQAWLARGATIAAEQAPAPARTLDAGLQRKAEGQAKVAGAHREALTKIRCELAALYARREAMHGRDAYVTSDDAHTIMLRLWPDDAARPPATVLSVVFSQRGWEWNNRLVKSERPSNHASDLRCWRWVGVEGARRTA